MKTKSGVLRLAAILLATLTFYACKKDNVTNSNAPAGSSKMSVYLTDDPIDYQKVLLDIQQIEVKVDTCMRNSDPDPLQPGCDSWHDVIHNHCEIWDTLNINPGIYDLLTLSNGVDTLLANGFLINGKIERIKFVLGDNNSVEVDSVTYPLKLVNNYNFVFLNLGRDDVDSLSSNNLQTYLDFDLDHSIWNVGNQYWLSPVLKVFSMHKSGGIDGRVTPVRSFGFIKAFNATDSGFALPTPAGGFRIWGLSEGTYSLLIHGRNGYQDTTLTGISVLPNKFTSAGEIELHK